MLKDDEDKDGNGNKRTRQQRKSVRLFCMFERARKRKVWRFFKRTEKLIV